MEPVNVTSDSKRFFNYLENNVFISKDEKDFIDLLTSNSQVYIFGGIIKDFYLNNENRDIDLVVDNISDEVDLCLNEYLVKKSRFGGYKLNICNHEYDIWKMDKTWGLELAPIIYKKILIDYMPATSFFNLTAALFNLNTKKFIFHPTFEKAINNKFLDIIFEPNPFPELCIIKSYEYYKNFNFKLSANIQSYIRRYFLVKKDKLTNIQLSHYGYVKFSLDELNSFFGDLNKEYSKVKSKSAFVPNQYSFDFD